MYVTTGDWVRQVLAVLGYPAYLVPVMIVVKVLGVVAIAPRRSAALSDLALCRHVPHLLVFVRRTSVSASPAAPCRPRWGSHCWPLSSRRTPPAKSLSPYVQAAML